jgi:hypothetical protein
MSVRELVAAWLAARRGLVPLSGAFVMRVSAWMDRWMTLEWACSMHA